MTSSNPIDPEELRGGCRELLLNGPLFFSQTAAEEARAAEIAAAVAKALAETPAAVPKAAAEKAAADKVCAQTPKHGGRRATTPKRYVVALESF